MWFREGILKTYGGMDKRLHIFLSSALDGLYGQCLASCRISNPKKKMSDKRRRDKTVPGGLLRSPVAVPTELPRVSIIRVLYNPVIRQLFINFMSQKSKFQFKNHRRIKKDEKTVTICE